MQFDPEIIGIQFALSDSNIFTVNRIKGYPSNIPEFTNSFTDIHLYIIKEYIIIVHLYLLSTST